MSGYHCHNSQEHGSTERGEFTNRVFNNPQGPWETQGMTHKNQLTLTEGLGLLNT